MRKTLHISLVILVVMILVAVHVEANDKKLHPRNRELIQKGLIPPMKFFPEVPRITPQEALSLYYSNKAIFIGVGYDARRIEGQWVLLDYMRYNIKRLKIPKGMVVVPYCG